MTKHQFEHLKEGDIVITNAMCKHNSGIRCRVTYICDNCIWVEPIYGERLFDRKDSSSNWNEISYKAANII